LSSQLAPSPNPDPGLGEGAIQTEYGGIDDPRLIPLLANLQVLIPWVRQWHPEPLRDYAGPPAGVYDQFFRDEAASTNLAPDRLHTWAATRRHSPAHSKGTPTQSLEHQVHPVAGALISAPRLECYKDVDNTCRRPAAG
jgi:hypothetical protein